MTADGAGVHHARAAAVRVGLRRCASLPRRVATAQQSQEQEGHGDPKMTSVHERGSFLFSARSCSVVPVAASGPLARSLRGLASEPLAATRGEHAMTTTTTKGYLVRRMDEAPTVPCPCGESTRAI